MVPLRERFSRSRVGHWGLAYIGGAWLTLQVVDVLADQFQWPLRLQQSITLILVAGFFVTAVLAWYHGEKGHQRFTAPELLILGTLLLIAAGTLSILRPSVPEADLVLPWPGRPVSPPTVVAVLPFHNLSGDPRDDFLASGLHEDILTRLSRVSALTVISRRSVLRYADGNRNLRVVGAELGARSLMEGSVRRDGNRLRVTVQLIDAVTDAHVWAETYDRPLDDVFEIQAEVATRIAEALEATLTPLESRRMTVRSPTGLGAWELVQRARSLRRPGNGGADEAEREERLLRDALALDPEYAVAWAHLSVNFALRPWDLAMDVAWGDSALTAARRAIELDPELAMGHYALGEAYHTVGFLDGAEEAFHAAIALDPNMAEAHLDLGRTAAVRGRFDDAIEHLGSALLRDPHMNEVRTQLGHSYAALGDLDTAGHWFEAEIELRRRTGRPYAESEAWGRWWAGEWDRAVEAGDRMSSRDPESPVLLAGLAELRLMAGDAPGAALAARSALARTRGREDVAYLFFATTTLGTALRITGDTAEARRLFEASRGSLAREVDHRDQYPLTYLEMSVVEDALGRRTDALRWAHRAYDVGSRHLHLISAHPAFSGLRQEPEFREILRAMRMDVERMRRHVEQRERAVGLR